MSTVNSRDRSLSKLLQEMVLLVAPLFPQRALHRVDPHV